MRQGSQNLINNRQGGRRRGRGGQRPQGMSGNAGGNARDTRQRGNAAQLLEKYKSMARDSQLAGDRVQTEYYLQFADHYFRVLEESRSRYEEQQGQGQQRRRNRDDEDEEFDGDEDMNSDGQDEGDEDGDNDVRARPQRRDRNERSERAPREDRAPREERSERAPREERSDRPERAPREDRPQRERFANDRGDRPQRDRPSTPRRDAGDNENGEERIAMGVLPPAIGTSDEVAEDAPKPRRRVRKPRDENGEDIAPAA
ncbi:DUF4167 domain-containing protein [Sphingomonas sp. LY29]|uniref:DUF4167 domain-containing protein n=1 Tax=Sphingomonas sp. LY29 TaxID=3095341 RepID=UPI002D7A2D38|nr:DUF4167 domain-containing protein [Sphingomonas sp. LY29]WRP25027.1 DUF4167 domain-containing protein [Sphingomonas sp. LY29]